MEILCFQLIKLITYDDVHFATMTNYSNPVHECHNRTKSIETQKQVKVSTENNKERPE